MPGSADTTYQPRNRGGPRVLASVHPGLIVHLCCSVLPELLVETLPVTAENGIVIFDFPQSRPPVQRGVWRSPSPAVRLPRAVSSPQPAPLLMTGPSRKRTPTRRPHWGSD